jgi:hypothetical protein
MTDLVIGFDYQKLIKQFRNLRKAKDFLATVNTGSVEAGRIDCNFRYSPLDGGIEQANVNLEGEGPFYLLSYRTLRYCMRRDNVKTPEIGDMIWLGNFRLKVIANFRGWPNDFVVMLPDTLAVLMCTILPFSRWADMIYRRLILTAAVWNLAKCNAAQWPHWGNLKWSKEYKEEK